uniref:Probable purine permease n=1 Tax=Kalanchoe fedtschenkoi TaxID=63787 RepID=A0A7N0T433_KALFE
MLSSAQPLQRHIMAVVADMELGAQPQSGEAAAGPAKEVKFWWWARMALYTFLVLAGQTVATLLGRLYYDDGGKSKWMVTLVPLIGFPVFIPYLFTRSYKMAGKNLTHSEQRQRSPLAVGAVYLGLGLLLVGTNMLYSVGLLYLPVSTFSLICASQLAFNAVFSYFLNSQKFTPFIVNSLVLLTVSSTLLVLQPDSDSPAGVSKPNYAISFICTVAASAGYALLLSLTQLAFKKVLRKESVAAVVDLIIYQSAIAAAVAVIGLFASGEWNTIASEMNSFKLGASSYVSTLAGIAVGWQVFGLGALGLIYEISALFSNVISTLGLPLVPVFAVVFFREKMDGIKVISMLLAVWGFASYAYQQYMDQTEPERVASAPRPETSADQPL